MIELFIAYIDSSGRPDFEDPENYVVASIITNERTWQGIDNSVKAIKMKHFPSLSDSDVEIHAKDILNRDERSLFRHLSWEEIGPGIYST